MKQRQPVDSDIARTFKEAKLRRLKRQGSVWKRMANHFQSSPLPDYDKDLKWIHRDPNKKPADELALDKGVKRLRRMKELNPRLSSDLQELARLLAERLPEQEDTGKDMHLGPNDIYDVLIGLNQDLKTGQEILFGQKIPLKSKLAKRKPMELDRLTLKLTQKMTEAEVFPRWFTEKIHQMIWKEHLHL